MTDNGFTPTQQRILDVLSDGKDHTRKELHSCLPDELSQLSAIQKHVSKIRKVLQPKGFLILCTIHNRRICYRYVRSVTALSSE